MMQAYAKTHLNVLVVINVGTKELKKKDESNIAGCFSCLFLCFSLHHSSLVISFLVLRSILISKIYKPAVLHID